MSRAHCIDCGSAVVVDPTGLCPDGHLVGPDGARIDAAIGVGVPYPDEPEPWTATVDVEPTAQPEDDAPRVPLPPSVPDAGTVLAPGSGDPVQPPTSPDGPTSSLRGTAAPPSAAEPTAPSSPRPPRPRALFGAGDTNGGGGLPGAGAERRDAAASTADTDDLMRELHSLSELDDLASLIAADAEPEPAGSPAATADPTLDVEPDRPAPPTNEAAASAAAGHRDGLAELRALEAAVQALTGSHEAEANPSPDAAPDRPAGHMGEPSAAAPTAEPAPSDGVVTPLPTSGVPADPDDGQEEDGERLAEVAHLFANRPGRLRDGQRPSQTAPPAVDEPPRPSFQRTPWSTNDPDGGGRPGEPAPYDAPVPPATPSARARSGPATNHPAGSGGDAIDLGNFTAKGGRVGTDRDGKRRRRRG